MRLEQIQKQYRVGFRHNPDHFKSNSFEVEVHQSRLVLVAVVKKKIGKRFRIVGILKEK